ncbi:MAG: hypothetical protein CVU89_05895 [Firmicutes bacterium HGW-Firmicutes-14]|nr:MAG: hypothetical protein CVU89_05895 [Firmicutes bacterium HGW-Firmicutes-14]
MDQKREISEHSLVSLERQTARLIEVLKVAIIVLFTVLLSIPVIGALFSMGKGSSHAGLTWSGAWLYGLLAVYGVNYWWSSCD